MNFEETSSRTIECPLCNKSSLFLAFVSKEGQMFLQNKCTCKDENQILSFEDYFQMINKFEYDKSMCLNHSNIKGIRFCVKCKIWLCEECIKNHTHDKEEDTLTVLKSKNKQIDLSKSAYHKRDWKQINKGTNKIIIKKPLENIVNKIIQLQDGRLVGLFKNYIIILSNSTFNKMGLFEAHKHLIYGILQLWDGRLISSSFDNSMKIWDMKTYKCIHTIETDVSNTLLFQLEEGELLAASHDNYIRIYNMSSFQLTTKLFQSQWAICSSINQLYDRTVMLICNKTIELFHHYLFKPIDIVSCDLTQNVSCFLQFGITRIITTNDNAINVWKYPKCKLSKMIKQDNSNIQTIIQLKDDRLVVGDSNNIIHIYDSFHLKEEVCLKDTSIGGDLITMMQLHDGTLLLLYYNNKKYNIALWDI